MKSLYKNLQRLCRDTRGGTAVTFALLLIPMMVAIGLAIDYSRASTVRNKLQAAIDAAALSAASAEGLSDDDRIAMGQKVFDANFPASLVGVDLNPTISINDTTVRVTVDTKLPTSIMKVVGINTMDLGGTTEVAVPTYKSSEIVLVLDYSGSMNSKGKYQAMRDAAIDLIQTISANDQIEDLKFGLVPFSAYVYATMPSDYIVNEPGGGTWSNCTQDRKWPYNVTDETPVAGNDDTKWGFDNPAHYNNCVQYLNRHLVVQPLTNNYDALINQLQIMQPHSYTHIATGMEFGWHLLSPNAPFTEGVAYDNEDYLKAIVLLTDGKQTQPAWGEGNSKSVPNGEENLEEMCTNIKDKGVMVVTIAFDLNDADTEERLRNCATSPAHFYDADDNTELSNAFKSITGQLAKAIHITK